MKGGLFPEDKTPPLSLEEAAQVISIELSSIERNINEDIARIISEIKLDNANSQIVDFFSSRTFGVITTNYDKLAEALASDNNCQSITPGLPIPKSPACVKVYHVHGSIDSPLNMIVTSNDYFNFINKDSYFSRKLSTVLHENTVVILGYSLGDTNLKAIISDYKGFSKSHAVGYNIFLVSRLAVNQHVKDYYSDCYGIRVLDELEISSFFKRLNQTIPRVERIDGKSIVNIRKVVYEGATFKESYLSLHDSFLNIISSLSAEGLSLDDARVVNVLGEIIDAKLKLTQKISAWDQYVHLAKWLIYLGAIFEIKNTAIEDIYLVAVLKSMRTMSKKSSFGYSWQAYKTWKERWPSVISSNRFLIRRYIQENIIDTEADAFLIVNSI